MLRRLFSLSLIVLLSVTSMAMAQEQGRGRPGGGGFFGGGFGGGFFGGSNPFQLAASEAVQKELSISEDQKAKLKTLGEDIRKEMQSAFTQPDREALAKLSEEERTKRRAEATEKAIESGRKLNETFRPKLAAILTPEQNTRLREIAIQAGGPALIQTDAELAKSLNITDAQKSKLDAISKEYREKQQQVFGNRNGGGNPQDAFAKIRETNEARDKALLEVLTADQKAELEKLKGKSFDVAALRPRGTGARPGARPQGGNNNN